MDHEQFLGNTLSQIAQEKCGIMKSNTPFVIGKFQPEIESIFRDQAIQCNSHIYYADKVIDFAKVNQKWTLFNRSSQEVVSFSPQLIGDYQVNNYKLVLVLIEVLRDMGYQIFKDQIISGLECVIQNTGIQGRFQILGQQPMIIADVAHNKDGIAQVMDQIVKMNTGELFIILGFMKDKDRSEIYNLLPLNAQYIAIQAHTPRALPYMELCKELMDHHLHAIGQENITEALALARSKAQDQDLILIIGSFFTLAELEIES
jgi:dihydrofolate synthase/folylpolyglutamate synthase